MGELMEIYRLHFCQVIDQISRNIKSIGLFKMWWDAKRCVFLPGKGNYWTLDPNCEKMFDNGNFRRKRKRRVDAVKTEDASALKLADTASLTGVAQRSPSPRDPKSSPEPSPCFNTFVSTMNSVMTGSSDGMRARDTGALLADLTRGREGVSPLSSYCHGESAPPSDPGHMSHRLSYYNPGLVNHFSVNNLIYNREGSEV